MTGSPARETCAIGRGAAGTRDHACLPAVREAAEKRWKPQPFFFPFWALPQAVAIFCWKSFDLPF